MIDFRTAVLRITRRVTNDEVCERLNVPMWRLLIGRYSKERDRMRHAPPVGSFEGPLAEWAREQAAELVELAEELEAQRADAAAAADLLDPPPTGGET